MDGTTEPIIVVIGHPIAGNPSQFAVERALRAIQLDWRVLSFDVKPEDIAAALQGFAVTGIAGVLIDQTVAPAASQWYSETTGGEPRVIDCLFRDDEYRLVGSWEQQTWLNDQVTQHSGGQKIWLGATLQDTPLGLDGFAKDACPAPPELDTVQQADLIAISQGCDGPVELEAEDWPASDGSTLIVDLTKGHPEIQTLRDRGYRVVATPERQVGTLLRCLQRWTGQQPPAGVIPDAIEEYLGV